ncbi:hypothetical protein ACOMHN_006933 [Nucella lapillus]
MAMKAVVGVVMMVVGMTAATLHFANQEDCTSTYNGLSPVHTLCLEEEDTATEVVLNQTMKDYIVQLHNSYRSYNVTPTASNMLKMVWDDKLAKTARKIAMRCIFDHDLNRNEPEWVSVDVGQNIGSGHSSWDTALERYYTEPERNSYNYGDMYKDSIGHYFQMASAQTNRVGCAQAFCSNTTYKHFRACNYAPAMDVGQDQMKQPYTSGDSCALCPDHCENNLCNCGELICLNNGQLDLNTCTCQCSGNRMGTNCSEIDCTQQDIFSGCRDGSIPSSQCGQPGTLLTDTTVCPHLCSICPACNGKTCDNGGTLNEDTCTCQCPSGYGGDTCEVECSTIECQNGGTLNAENCRCDCPLEFDGRYCDHACSCAHRNNSMIYKKDEVCMCGCVGNYYGEHCDIECVDKLSYCTWAFTFMDCGANFMANCHHTCRQVYCQNLFTPADNSTDSS